MNENRRHSDMNDKPEIMALMISLRQLKISYTTLFPLRQFKVVIGIFEQLTLFIVTSEGMLNLGSIKAMIEQIILSVFFFFQFLVYLFSQKQILYELSPELLQLFHFYLSADFLSYSNSLT